MSASDSYKSKLHTSISETIARFQYTGDEQQAFWLGALEHAAKSDDVAASVAAGHEAVRAHRNIEITERHRLKTQQCSQSDGSTFASGPEYAHDRAAFNQWQAEAFDVEPEADSDQETDSAQQHDLLHELIPALPLEDQTIVRARLSGVSWTDLAKQIGCSRLNVRARYLTIQKRLTVLAWCEQNPLEADALDRLTKRQRATVEALLAGRKYAETTLRRALASGKLSASTVTHVKKLARLGQPRPLRIGSRKRRRELTV